MTAPMLRAAVTLVHAVPDLVLELRLRGERTVYSAHASSSRPRLHPICHLRQLLADDHASGGDRFAEVEAVEIVGEGVRDLGGGLYATRSGLGARRCFATFLPAAEVGDLITQNAPCGPSELVTATVKPDVELAVSCVVLEANHPVLQGVLDVAARWAHEACLIEELVSA